MLPGSDEDAVTALYQMHYRPLVRLATLLVGDIALAEGVVQDCFVVMLGGWRRLRAADRALPYLRRSVIDRGRMRLAAPNTLTGNTGRPPFGRHVPFRLAAPGPVSA